MSISFTLDVGASKMSPEIGARGLLLPVFEALPSHWRAIYVDTAEVATAAPRLCPQITISRSVSGDAYVSETQFKSAWASISIPDCVARPDDVQYPRYDRAAIVYGEILELDIGDGSDLDVSAIARKT